MVRDLSKVLVLAGVGIVLVVAYALVRIWQQGETDERRPADAIVVLGAAQFNGRPSPVFAARLDHAIDLYREGLAPILIVTGGRQPGDRTTEAATARAYAAARGVPDGAILAEDQGRTTLESLAGVAEVMRTHGLRSAVFVSDRPHMLRVLRMAADQGIEAWGSPTSTSPIEHDVGRRARAMMHELGGLAAYFLWGGSPPENAPETGL